MNRLELWLNQATCCLSAESTAQVRREIHEHYVSAVAVALANNLNDDQAEQAAVAALGDAKEANRQYRRVLLTSAEARMLHRSNREARAFCARPWLRLLLAIAPVAAVIASLTFALRDQDTISWSLFAGAAAVTVLFFGSYLPVYTVTRSRIFRAVKWAVLLCVMAICYRWPWLSFACLWPIAHIEWNRVSIRRKLPVAQWPRQLYL
jgi:hypothetical protein